MNQENQTPEYLNVDSLLEQSSRSDDEVERKLAQLLKQDIFREKTRQIFNEQVGTVQFMKKVQEYADEQIDKRLFKNVKVILGLLFSWIISLGIAFIIGKYT